MSPFQEPFKHITNTMKLHINDVCSHQAFHYRHMICKHDHKKCVAPANDPLSAWLFIAEPTAESQLEDGKISPCLQGMSS